MSRLVPLFSRTSRKDWKILPSALLAGLLALGGCSASESCVDLTYKVRPDALTLRPGEVATLRAYQIECGGTRESVLTDVRWDSSNPAAISVDSLSGQVRALSAAASATVTARVRRGSDTHKTVPGLQASVFTTGL